MPKLKLAKLKAAAYTLRKILKLISYIKGIFTPRDCSSSTTRVVAKSAFFDSTCNVAEKELNGALGN